MLIVVNYYIFILHFSWTRVSPFVFDKWRLRGGSRVEVAIFIALVLLVL
jgi:hypothetical protein